MTRGSPLNQHRSSSKATVYSKEHTEILQSDIVILGGGIAGLATALALHRNGFSSLVLERAEKMRTSGTSMGLWANAWRALELLGVAHDLREHYININRVELIDKDGNLRKEIDLQNEKRWKHELRCVDRKHLLEELAKPLPEGAIRYSSKVVCIHKATKINPRTIVRLQDGTIISTRVLIGCDGAQSVVSQCLGLSPPTLAGYYTIRGMAMYPEGHMFAPVFQQFVGDGVRAGIAPIDSTRVYWFISNGRCSEVPTGMYEPENMRHEALTLLHGFPKRIIDVVKKTKAETLIASTIRLRWLWPGNITGPDFSQGGVTVAGDAMHPMPPDLAQGGCCALEDAIVLARWLSKAAMEDEKMLETGQKHTTQSAHGMGIEQALLMYAQERRDRAWSLTTQAWLVGKVLNAGSSFLRFLRESIVLPNMQASMLVAHTQFDCGPLQIDVPEWL